jgi:hypothetical protein
MPLARAVVALPPEVFATLGRAVTALFRISRLPEFQRQVDLDACTTARHDAGNAGVMMGYDFHLASSGPRLIEINTNAGGALVNALHSASMVTAEDARCLCRGWLPVETLEDHIVLAFRAEQEAGAPGRALRRMAICDDDPPAQFLYPEFELYRALFARHGIEAEIVDTASLVRRDDGLAAGGGDGAPFDLVYLRDTDFLLAAPRSRALRDAWLAGEVVVTPSPREHHLLADKRRLVLFSSPERLRALGASEEDARLLGEVVPQTRPLAELGLEDAWRDRRGWVFKPAAAFGSRAVYRGDKISRRKLDEIFELGGFLAQRAVTPGQIRVSTSEGPREMKFDVRAYAYRDEILLLGARSYEGQVTTMRTPGGGFTAICVCA